jgi:aromatic ring-opening dioxygenase catalytic subunit (LigB family)
VKDKAVQPSLYLPHGGGPCFFMDDPQGIWTGMAAFLRGYHKDLPARPKAIIVVSAHWETKGFAFGAASRPGMIYEYSGFPPHTYQLNYPIAGAPALAARAAELLRSKGIEASVDAARGIDHGLFIPMMLSFPHADIPMIEMSVEKTFDPQLHLDAGKALAALRAEGVLIVGSGMSFHNMRGYGDPRFTAPSEEFDHWLTAAAESEPDKCEALLAAWRDAPSGRLSHPREEHLLPLMVAAGASHGKGQRIYSEQVMNTAISAFRFD